MPILGQVTLPLVLFFLIHVIENMGFEAVLGRDFLEDKSAVIDFCNRTIQLTDEDNYDTKSER